MRAVRNFLNGAQVEKVLPDLLCTELAGRGMIELGEQGDGADVPIFGGDHRISDRIMREAYLVFVTGGDPARRCAGAFLG